MRAWKVGFAQAPWEFCVSDGRELIELRCRNGHKALLLAAGIRTGRISWCAKCGADLRAEPDQPPAAADDAPVEGADKLASPALHSVRDTGRSR